MDTGRLKVFSLNANDNVGKTLNDFGFFVKANRSYSSVYYKCGVDEIDALFREKPHYKQGFISYLICTERAFIINFEKENNTILDGLCIFREDIIGFEVLKDKTIEVSQPSIGRATASNVLKLEAGVVGMIAGSLLDKSGTSKTKVVNGSEIILSYIGSNGEPKKVSIYSEEKNFQALYVFINTYYKRELSEEAKVDKTSIGFCFIATATYKDHFSEEVIFFRKYRDVILNTNLLGRFVTFMYYSLSPSLSKFVFRSKTLNLLSKKCLDRVYATLKKKYNVQLSKYKDD